MNAIRPRAGRVALALAGLLAVVLTGAALAQTAPSRVVILSTTTSTQDSGLLDVLVPMFERKTGFSVKTISVGTGQALALGRAREADVILVHAPSVEKKYVEEGKMQNRRLVMYNDFVVVGPADDPAKVKGLKAAEAMKRIAAAQARFVSRGDKSGTHTLELAIWKQAGHRADGRWYIESGQGMGQTLNIANDRPRLHAHRPRDWLAFGKRIDLPILVEGDRPLLNIYSVMEVNPANGPGQRRRAARPSPTSC